MNDYISGDAFGLHESVMIHRLANIAGDVEFGENSRIDAFVTITGTVKAGKNCHIGNGVSIFGSEGVEIGDDSAISPGAKIFTGSFDAGTMYLGNPQVKNHDAIKGPVIIGDKCIVGANSVVLPNSIIGGNTCVGALSLVNGHIASGIWAGIPAKRKK